MNRYNFNEEKHIHSLDGKPLIGTTTALGIISKELTWWASGMCAGEMGWLNSKKHDQNERLVKAGAKLTDIKLMNIGEYLKLLDMAYRAHHELKEKRAGEGTDLHALAEEWIKFKMNGGKESQSDNELFAYVAPEVLSSFITWCENNVKRFLFSEVHCYSERLWVGGKTDFGYEDMNGNYVLADIKSRDKDYFSDHVQMGGYDLLLRSGGYDKDGNLIWQWTKPFHRHAVFTLGENFKKPVFSESPIKNCEAFECALGLYKIKQMYEKDK